jgi:succinyl-diaminopimelate desuccinylase
MAPPIERLAQRTLELCAIDSPIGEEKAIADHVERWARARFKPEQVYRWSHSLVLGDLDDPRPSIGLIGHLDTVPAGGSPHRARIEGDRLFGLGASDMKGGVAVMMELIDALPRAELPVNLVLVLYEREEGPYLESGLGPVLEKVGALKKLSLGIAMEPTDNVVQVGCVGSLHATLRFHGRAAHSARPWQGKNAIHLAGPLLSELLALPPREVVQSGFKYREVASVTRASGGQARNVVPDGFELNLNYRFAPGRTVDEAIATVIELVGGRAEVEITDRAPSGRVCADNPYFQQLLATTGLPADAKQAWTDVARFSEAGVDAVNFGPGETAQAHQANESASIAALGVAYEKLAAFLTAHKG